MTTEVDNQAGLTIGIQAILRSGRCRVLGRSNAQLADKVAFDLQLEHSAAFYRTSQRFNLVPKCEQPLSLFYDACFVEPF